MMYFKSTCGGSEYEDFMTLSEMEELERFEMEELKMNAFRDRLAQLIHDRLGEDALEKHLHEWIEYYQKRAQTQLEEKYDPSIYR